MGAAAIPHLHNPMGRGEKTFLLDPPTCHITSILLHLQYCCVVPPLALFVTSIEVWEGLVRPQSLL